MSIGDQFTPPLHSDYHCPIHSFHRPITRHPDQVSLTDSQTDKRQFSFLLTLPRRHVKTVFVLVLGFFHFFLCTLYTAEAAAVIVLRINVCANKSYKGLSPAFEQSSERKLFLLVCFSSSSFLKFV